MPISLADAVFWLAVAACALAQAAILRSVLALRPGAAAADPQRGAHSPYADAPALPASTRLASRPVEILWAVLPAVGLALLLLLTWRALHPASGSAPGGLAPLAAAAPAAAAPASGA
jgi:heme/copper-type cytochrome/quinol oxidase subunit 2